MQKADKVCSSHHTSSVQSLATEFCDVTMWVQKAIRQREEKLGRAIRQRHTILDIEILEDGRMCQENMTTCFAMLFHRH